MTRINLIINTFIEPILYRIDTAISELENSKLSKNEDDRLKQIKNNIISIIDTYLKNCQREIENRFPYFMDIASELPDGITVSDMTKDFVKFYDSLNNSIEKLDLDNLVDNQQETLKILYEMKKKGENYKQTVKEVTNWNKKSINKAGQILKEIEDMEQELDSILNPKDISQMYQIDDNEEMSAYDKFMSIVSESSADDLSVDDILNDINMSLDKKAEYDFSNLNSELPEIKVDSIDEAEEKTPYNNLMDSINDANKFIEEISKDNPKVTDESSKDYLDRTIKDFNDYIDSLNEEENQPKNDEIVENSKEKVDDISNVVYGYINLNDEIIKKDQELSEKNLIKNKFVKRCISQLKLNKEILEVKLQMYGIDIEQALSNPKQAIEDARIRKSLGVVNITYVGNYERLFNYVKLIRDYSYKAIPLEFDNHFQKTL